VSELRERECPLLEPALLPPGQALAFPEFHKENTKMELAADARAGGTGGEPTVSPAQLAQRLGLPASNLRLLARSLTHRSYVNEHADVPEDNERLEFLGDAVLDFLVGAWLYNRYPEMAEGDLTRMRSALVRTEQLAAFARDLDLGSAMRLGRGELQGGGRERSALLCATFEAVTGAVFLDQGIEAAREFVLPFLRRTAEEIVLQPDIYDAKSRLQEWAQSRRLGIPRYETRSAEGPDHAKTFVVEVYVNGDLAGTGSGPNKQVAAQNAAAGALAQRDLDYGGGIDG
jgi:ribonuclease-3